MKLLFEKYAWLLIVILVSLITIMPLLSTLNTSFVDSNDIWEHLKATVLATYVKTTLKLLVGVLSFTFIIGTLSAWLVSMYEFPLSKFLTWGLILPMAVPSYIVAYIYTDLFEYSGSIQVGIRYLFNYKTFHDYYFPEIRSLSGAIFLISIVLYPYVFFLAKNSFSRQAGNTLEAAKVLNQNPVQIFFKISLPMAWPMIAAGLSLVGMEVLNDYGTVDYFAIQTLSVGIFDIWTNLNSLATAAKLSMFLIAIVVLLLLFEFSLRKNKDFTNSYQSNNYTSKQKLKGFKAVLATTFCVLPLIVGFIIPLITLILNSITVYDVSINKNIITYAKNTFFLAFGVASIASILGLILAYANRLTQSKLLYMLTKLSIIGYAVPGSVLAIGVISYTTTADSYLSSLTSPLFLSSSIFTVILGYLARFNSIAYSSINSGLQSISTNIDDAAISLGETRMGVLKKIHLPLLNQSIFVALILVAVDSIKELPMTMLLSPANFVTLATHVQQYASDDLFEESSLAALLIILTGIIPIILINKYFSKNQIEENL